MMSVRQTIKQRFMPQGILGNLGSESIEHPLRLWRLAIILQTMQKPDVTNGIGLFSWVDFQISSHTKNKRTGSWDGLAPAWRAGDEDSSAS